MASALLAIALPAYGGDTLFSNQHLAYERLSEEDRNKLSRSQFAKATWIYYVLGLIDLKKNRRDAAHDGDRTEP